MYAFEFVVSNSCKNICIYQYVNCEGIFCSQWIPEIRIQDYNLVYSLNSWTMMDFLPSIRNRRSQIRMSQNLVKKSFFLDVNYDGIFPLLDSGDETRHCPQRPDHYVSPEGASHGTNLEPAPASASPRTVLLAGHRLLLQNGR